MRRHGRLAAAAAAVALACSALPAQAQTLPIADAIARAIQSSAGLAIKVRSTLYHGGAPGIGTKDSLGCTVSPMRTLAVDPKVIPRRSIVFIKETVGLMMPSGKRHDGLWYASDTGGAIKGAKVDLFTGQGRSSMTQFLSNGLSLGALSAIKVGTFSGCPPRD